MTQELDTNLSSKNLLTEQFSKAVELAKARKYLDAIQEYSKLPRYKEVLIQKAIAYKELKHYSLAEVLLNEALTAKFSDDSIVDNDTITLNNLGSLYYTLEKNLTASDYYLASYYADNSNKEALWNYGATQIRRYCDGEDIDLNFAWRCYDARLNFYDLTVSHNMPYWDFSSRGQSIAVLWDQGIGDTIMFARYLPYLYNYFSEVYVQCPTSLAPVISKHWNLYDKKCSYCVSITSLGRLVNYIPTGNWLAGNWKSPGNGRIGYVNSGSSIHRNDYNRSCPLPLIGEKLEFYGNWLNTIDILNEYDLIVSVDTSIVHMCGALGMPCLVLMPLANSDYRWGTVGSENKWYPSVKVIRNPGTWKECIKKSLLSI